VWRSAWRSRRLRAAGPPRLGPLRRQSRTSGDARPSGSTVVRRWLDGRPIRSRRPGSRAAIADPGNTDRRPMDGCSGSWHGVDHSHASTRAGSIYTPLEQGGSSPPKWNISLPRPFVRGAKLKSRGRRGCPRQQSGQEQRGSNP
jgi:hypothetical protein